MITRAVQRRRPRLVAILVPGAAVAVLGLFAMVALATVTDTHTGTECDIQVANKSGTQLCTTTAGAKVRYIGDSNQTFGSSGTGTFNPFVRLQGSPTEAGYNTNGAVQFESKTGTWTHAIKVSEIPVRTEDGCTNCWELFVDVNDSNNQKVISLNDMEIWFTTNPSLVGYVQPTGFPSGASLEYDFAGTIKINDVNQGSGRGDLRYMVPRTGITIPANCQYGNPSCATYFVLYSKWGTTSGFPSDGGFEEWKVKIYPTPPDISVAKTPDSGTVNAGADAVFTIVVTNNGPIAAENVSLSDVLPDSGLSWTVGGADAASCAGTNPHAGGSTLTCNFGTVAFPGSRTITLTSPTDADDCGTIANTVTVTSSNEDSAASSNNTDNGSISVACAAIQILKQSTKAGNPLVATDGVVFSITGPGGYNASVTDNDTLGTTPDEDATTGEVCISGLEPGAYTVNETTAPDGYGDASETDVVATAVDGTDCGANAPSTANSAVFRNAPLADLLVRVEGQDSGEILSSIECVDSADVSIGSVGSGTPVDPAELDVNDLKPDTYTCTIVIDP